MRSRILVIITAMLLFGVGFAVYAYNSNRSTTDTVAASCCCCSGDSCPMKSADGKAAAKTEAGHECCCKGDGASCPMKSKDGKSGDKMAMTADGKHSCPMMSGDAAHKMDGAKHEGMAGHDMKMANGETCPMMKDGKAADMHKGMAGKDGKAAGCSCACCNHDKEKKATAAI